MTSLFTNDSITQPEPVQTEQRNDSSTQEFFLSDYGKLVNGKADEPKNERPEKNGKKEKDPEQYASRKPITEVLHDIYDKN